MLTLRRAGDADCLRVYLWRNRAEDRKWHFDQQPIRWYKHKAWWEDYTGTHYIAQHDGEFCGYVAIEPGELGLEVDITVDVEFRGKGLGVDMLHSALAAHGAGVYIAYIKTDNAASRNIFIKAGFDEPTVTTRNGQDCYVCRRVTT